MTAAPNIQKPLKSELSPTRFGDAVQQLASQVDEVFIANLSYENFQSALSQHGAIGNKLEEILVIVLCESISQVVDEKGLFTHDADRVFRVVFFGVSKTVTETIIGKLQGALHDRLISISPLFKDELLQIDVQRLTVDEEASKISSPDNNYAQDSSDIHGAAPDWRSRLQHAISRDADDLPQPGHTPIPKASVRNDVELTGQFANLTEICYQAFWNVEKNHLTAFRSEAMTNADENEVSSKSLLSESGLERAVLELEAILMSSNLDALVQLKQENKPFVAWNSVRFETIQRHRSFERYMAGMAMLPDNAQDMVLFELVDVPASLSETAIRSTIEQLKRRCRAVVVQLPIGTTSFKFWRKAGVYAVGFECPVGVEDEKAIFGLIERFASQAEEEGLKAYAMGLSSLSLVTAAVTAGCAYVEGTAVVPPSSSPTGVASFAVSDLVSSLITG